MLSLLSVEVVIRLNNLLKGSSTELGDSRLSTLGFNKVTTQQGSARWLLNTLCDPILNSMVLAAPVIIIDNFADFLSISALGIKAYINPLKYQL